MGRTSLIDWLDYFERHGRAPAYIQKRGLRREVWTYAQILELGRRFAGELEARGIRKGDRVILWGHDSAEWVATFLGCMVAGVVAVPLDRVGSPAFALRIHAEVSAKLVVCARDLRGQVASLPHLVLEEIPATVASRSAEVFRLDLHLPDILQIVFTSGTTDEPKGVVITHGNVLANLEPFEPEIAKYLRYERWVHPLRFLDLVPLSHVFGQFMGIFVPPLLGAVVVFPEHQAPGEVLRTIKQEQVSVLVAVPRMIDSLQTHLQNRVADRHGEKWLPEQLAAAAKEKAWRRWWRFREIHRLFGWRFWAIVSGGATLDSTSEEFWSRIGIAVLQGYGLTETTSLVSVNHPFRRGAGSIGRVLPGRDLKLSETGEILVRGASIAGAYWQKGALQPTPDEDGWLRTGDLGELDSAGFLRFKGRQKNLIVTPEGMKVFPQDLENPLRRDPRVRDAVVFGRERGGNAEPAAALLMASGADAEAVVADVNRSLAPYQQIRHWFTWREPDFPRTPTQKPRIAEVRARAMAHFEGQEVESAPRSQLASLLTQVMGRRDASVPDADLGLSSLERVELMCALEDRYQISLNDADFAEIRTIDQLERLVDTPVRSGPPVTFPRWAQHPIVQVIRVFIYHLVTLPLTYLLSAPRVKGRELLDAVRGPVLVISNHVTYIDVGFILAALPSRLRRRLAVAMEGELIQRMRHPAGAAPVRWLSRIAYILVTSLFNVFPLSKTGGFRDSFAFAGSLVDRGHSVLVFPEGLRTRDGELAPFQNGIGVLATGLQIPVIPLRIDGLWKVKQAGWRGFAPWGSIQVRTGEPVTFASGEDAQVVARRLEAIVRTL